MKILFFSQDYTTHVYRFLTKMVRGNHDVWFLRLEANPVTYEKRPLPEGVKQIDWEGCHTFNLNGWGKARLYLSFRKILKDIKPDLVQVGPVQTCGFFTALTGFRPILLMSWGSDILISPYKNKLNRFITRYTINRSTMMLADCTTVRDKIIELSDYPEERIVSFPWGVELSQFQSGNNNLKLREQLDWQDKKVVIFTRSLEPMYGIETLMETIKSTIEKDDNIRFLLVGNGSLSGKMSSFIEDDNLNEYVNQVGRVDSTVLPDYYREADLYISTSYSDGTSISMLEAMACKLPVIVTDLPSNREWVRPDINGWLVQPGNSKAFGTSILAAFKQQEKLAAIGQANLTLVHEKADWSKNSDLLLEAYEKIAGRVYR
ncbi:glycosyltransferase family 4 protein [Chloroflexota bacterium]